MTVYIATNFKKPGGHKSNNIHCIKSRILDACISKTVYKNYIQKEKEKGKKISSKKK